MSWIVVARKDVADAGRSRLLLATVAVLLGFVVIIALLEGAVAGTGPTEFVALLGVPLLVVVPISALVVGYLSVVGERQSGSLKFLLGLSPSRRAVVAGKFVGRSAVMAAAIAAAFVAAVGCSLLLYQTVAVVDLLAFLAVTIAFACSFVGVAVGLSSFLRTRRAAMTAAIGCYLAFVFFWELLITGVYYAVVGSFPGQQVAPWFILLERLNPVTAYEVVGSAVIEGEIVHFASVTARPGAAGLSVTEQLGGPVPVYLEPWVSGLTLVAWATVPVVVGYLRFRCVDL